MVFPIHITIKHIEEKIPELIEFDIFTRKIGRDRIIDGEFISSMSIEPTMEEDDATEDSHN